MLLASQVDALAIFTLTVAVVGALTGVMSLAWAIVSHRSAGVRVAVDFAPGLAQTRGFLAIDLKRAKPGPMGYGMEGLPAFCATVRNTGRLAARVVSIEMHVGLFSYKSFEMPFSPSLPHAIDVSDRATWFFHAQDAVAVASAQQSVHPDSTARDLYVTVELGSGAKVRSRSVPLARAIDVLVAATATSA